MNSLKDAGLGLETAMRIAGYNQDDIDEAVKENEKNKPVVPIIPTQETLIE